VRGKEPVERRGPTFALKVLDSVARKDDLPKKRSLSPYEERVGATGETD
jgi:hypothetical protein